MKMPIGNLPAVVVEFTDEVLMPAAQVRGGALPFTLGIVAGLAAKQAPQMAAQYVPALKALGVVPNSYHTKGLAADIRPKDPAQLEELWQLADQMNETGGAG